MYVMYYTDNNGKTLDSDECWSQAPSYLAFPSETASHTSHISDNKSHNITLAIDWILNGVSDDGLQAALGGIKIGQISGVAVTNDSVYILHRGTHTWDLR